LLEDRFTKHEERVSKLFAPMPIKDKLQIGAFIAAIATGLATILKLVGL
jgi:hypothetical protein